MKRIASEGDNSLMPSPECAVNNCGWDNLNRRGAMDLAKRLESHWHDKGYFEVRFWAEPIDERFDKIGTHELYRVKCNLLNGLPPSHPNNME